MGFRDLGAGCGSCGTRDEDDFEDHDDIYCVCCGEINAEMAEEQRIEDLKNESPLYRR